MGLYRIEGKICTSTTLKYNLHMGVHKTLLVFDCIADDIMVYG